MLSVATPYAHAQDKVYWTDQTDDKIKRANLDGSSVEDVVTGIATPRGIGGSGDYVYWDDDGTLKLQRADYTGTLPIAATSAEDLVTGIDDAKDVDVSGDKVYWADKTTGKIRRANLDGSSPEDVLTGLTNPRAITVYNGKIYWADETDDNMQRANLDGSDIEVLISSGVDARGLAIDETNSKIYWTDKLLGKIKRANLDGTTPEDVLTGLTHPYGFDIDNVNGKMYWADKTDGKIKRANLDGTLPEDILTGLTDPTYVVVQVSGLFPVELTAFDAAVDGADVLLGWQTASETNNAGFEIQSRDSRFEIRNSDWEVIDFVEGYGTTELPRSYTYRLEDLAPGRYSFRLKQIDFDGTFEYHPEVEVVVEMTERFVVEPAYPNPFNPQAQFRFAVHRQQQVRVDLYDLLGRRVKVLYEGAPSVGQMHTVRIDGSDLPSGMYVVRLVGEQFVEAQTVTLLK